MCGICGCAGDSSADDDTALNLHAKGQIQTLALNKIQHKDQKHIEQHLLHANDHQAEHNRELFLGNHILCLNLVSSPGSGKTKLLEKTLSLLHPDQPCYVIEGDQQTQQDAERIAATGVEAVQVNTGTGCHLDATMVQQGATHLNMKRGSFLFVENVGNLVCPALFDLGEDAKVALISVTEGEDKPLKYPHMFRASRLMIINKIDLLPYVEFDVDKCIAFAKQVNPEIEVLQMSAQSGEGIGDWLGWLQKQRQHLFKLASAS